MTDTLPPSPGERRLDRPPSDRYRDDAAPDAGVPPSGSAARATVLGVLAMVAGAAATVVLGGVLALSAGLLVVAVAAGWIIGGAVRIGARASLSSGARGALAVALAAIGVIIGQVGLWLYARAEGGVLDPVDYLAQTFGLLVPAQAVLALAAAWRTAR